MRLLTTAWLLSACLLTGTVQGQQWGDLTATFLYDGDVPQPTQLQITKDTEFCSKHSPVDESLTVNEKNKGLANVVVFLYLAKGGTKPAVHASYEASRQGKVKLDNNKCRFEPHVVALRTTQTLLMTNSDEVGHNCKIDTLASPPINFTIPAGGDISRQFTAEERLPAKVSCSIHPWMSGWLVVRESPYMGISDADGKLSIKNLPVGKWTFQVWHEKAGYVRQVQQDGKAAEWSKGRVEVTIKAGQNALGEIKLAPAAFAE